MLISAEKVCFSLNDILGPHFELFEFIRFLRDSYVRAVSAYALVPRDH